MDATPYRAFALIDDKPVRVTVLRHEDSTVIVTTGARQYRRAHVFATADEATAARDAQANDLDL